MAMLDGWRSCPRCGGAVSAEPGVARCAACGSAYWAASQATACALVVDDEGRLLLGRRAVAPFAGRWDLPGGFLEEGEHPLDCLRRELREETGLEVEPVRCLGIWMDTYAEDVSQPGAVATLNLYWTARVLGGELRADDDVAELAWFAPGELPPDDEVAFRNVPLVLRAWRDEQA